MPTSRKTSAAKRATTVAKKPPLPPSRPEPIFPPNYPVLVPADTPIDQLPIDHPLARAAREKRTAARLPNG